MLTRSASSRRRRASRSAASSPQARPPRDGTCSASTSPGRRASIAVSPVDPDHERTTICVEINRSPRHSIIPDINFESRDYSSESPPSIRSPRGSLVPDSVMSPRNSLVPDFNRSPRNSLVPSDAYSRSPRNSLVPEAALSPRNSLVPSDCYSRSPRNSLTPDTINRSHRERMESPRHSLVPGEANSYSLTPIDFNRSPRNSLVPEVSRSPRHSLVPSEAVLWNQRSPVHDEPPRKYSLVSVSEMQHGHNRSPRGSIAPETLSMRTSPRGSIGGEIVEERGARERSPRGSLGSNRLLAETIEPGASSSTARTPRGSLTLTFQEPLHTERRSSADNPSGSRSGYGRSASPYRSSARVNHGYSASVWSEGGSRRASSSVSQVNLTQVSGDEQRRLCNESKSADVEQAPCLSLGITLTTYGSVAYQLKDANMEASGTCDFVCKALRIVNKTVAVTVLLVCLSSLFVLMLIMGFQFLRDCPREPRIPVYMLVGGGVGCLKTVCLLYGQLHTRRFDMTNPSSKPSVGWRVLNICLTLFLLVWFAIGNYWILRIKWPDYSPTLFEPNRWCHRTLYVFSLVQLCIVYGLVTAMVLLVVMLAGCQIAGCSWLGPARYK